MLLLRDLVLVNVTAVTVNKKDIVTEVTAVWGKARQLEDGPLALPFFA